MARKRFKKSERLSPLLATLIDAAEHAREDAEGRDIRSAAQALREFGQLALWALPIHGVFVPNNNDVSMIVERVAKQHLNWEEARSEVREALKAIEAFAERHPIESAENHLRAVSDEEYFYAWSGVRRHARRPGGRLSAAMKAPRCGSRIRVRSHVRRRSRGEFKHGDRLMRARGLVQWAWL